MINTSNLPHSAPSNIMGKESESFKGRFVRGVESLSRGIITIVAFVGAFLAAIVINKGVFVQSSDTEEGKNAVKRLAKITHTIAQGLLSILGIAVNSLPNHILLEGVRLATEKDSACVISRDVFMLGQILLSSNIENTPIYSTMEEWKAIA